MPGLFNECQPPWPPDSFNSNTSRPRTNNHRQRGPSSPQEAMRRLLEDLRGSVIEIGAGVGISFPHYPAEVGSVLAIEPDPRYRTRAMQEAELSPVPIQVVPGDAEALPVPDASKDAAAISRLLCTVPSSARALAELHRVVRPGGELRFFEHVRSDRALIACLQDSVAAPWHRFRGCHANRDTVAAIERAGFEIVAISRFNLSWIRFGPAAPRVIGRAIRR
ncbi:class I SAM-dependent methyltransferase [Saccharopolyspora sp. 5N708]|uniref:class I SAM-dependent methyltransferase n=1 Tax=Saccharopolyspora sp. 5N708 TaxID=3457424 RepID=UPI003FCEF2A6